MTKMVYTVIRRPKGNNPGQTNVGWEDDGVSEAVPMAGYLITSRTPKGKTRQYAALLVKEHTKDGILIVDEIPVGDTFETRAQAAFAIWREYYKKTKDAKRATRVAEDNQREKRRHDREIRKMWRGTEQGQRQYKDELNKQARERRAHMTPEQKASEAAKRKLKRQCQKAGGALDQWMNYS